MRRPASGTRDAPKGTEEADVRRTEDRGTGARRRGTRPLLSVGLLALGVAFLAGCDSLLDVELPGQVPEESLEDPELADAMVSGVVADFECAYNNYTFGAAAHSDEFIPSSGNLVQRNWSSRRITASFDNYVNGTCEGNGFGLWTTLQTARFQADDVFDRLEGFSDEEVADRTGKMATVSAYGGYAYTLFGEGFCQVRFDGGPVLEPVESLELARDRFGRAIGLAQQAGDDEVLGMARVGLARTLLDLGGDQNLQAAIDTAELVPEGFEKLALRDGPSPSLDRRWNKGFEFFINIGHHSVAPEFRGLEWEGVEDPRVPVEDAGQFGFDGVTPLWITTKYPARSSDIPLATWEEAQLIIAEASVRLGDPGRAEAIIDDLHARAGLPDYDPAEDTTPGPTDDEVLNHVLQERSRALFQEGGHRLNDMLRHGIPFLSGLDPTGQPYGEATCFPLPVAEEG